MMWVSLTLAARRVLTQTDDARRETAALRHRIAALGAAGLRISATLDLDTVLADVVGSTRELTGARYGVIATVDEAGVPTRKSVFSGFTPELVTGEPRDLPRTIRTERPRLVLLDLMLLDADGIELMRQMPELADLPVIFRATRGGS